MHTVKPNPSASPKGLEILPNFTVHRQPTYIKIAVPKNSPMNIEMHFLSPGTVIKRVRLKNQEMNS